MSPPTPHREQRFSDLYDSAYVDVLRFLRRRSAPEVAEDVAHEAFLIAWRRLDDVPHTLDGARAWLFATARNCMLSDRRARQRYEQLGVRIAETLPPLHHDGSPDAALRLDLITAWSQLSTAQQEVLSLAFWEELPATAAGRALGISAATYRVRLHRARHALRRHLDADPEAEMRLAPVEPSPFPASTTEMTT